MAIEVNPDLGMDVADIRIEIVGTVTNPPAAAPDNEDEEN